MKPFLFEIEKEADGIECLTDNEAEKRFKTDIDFFAERGIDLQDYLAEPAGSDYKETIKEYNTGTPPSPDGPYTDSKPDQTKNPFDPK
ncbi:MAG: hypothetical protein QNJ44_02085 [Rhodobacter sp.]|nr:hypothetical protein [Rhodobacter sp.]